MVEENKVQVITDELDFNSSFSDFLKARELMKKGTGYRTVAVIGCQSSGKSTLLNLLFDTGFDVMDKVKGRAQTTKGIWMSATIDDNPTLIFDIEGTDSKERGEQRMTFEQTTSLFALAISDVLLINMWTTDIGRYGASNYGLLKVIFEVNLKLFGQQSAKKLLFVLRDFIEEENDFEAIKEIIDTDVNKIWSEMHKPEEYKDSNPQDFFQFEFCLMPHKILEKQKFADTAKNLRTRFSVGQDNSLFPESGAKNVPVDGLSFFIERTWDDIRNQKELNLPDQREMVANYRCNECKDEAIALTTQEAQKLRTQSDKSLIADFKERCTQIIKIAINHYDEQAHHYENKVFKKFQKELTEQIMQNLYTCFDQQLKFISQETFYKFKRETEKLEKRDLDEIAYELHKVLGLIRASCMEQGFRKSTRALILEGSNWGEFVDNYENDLNKHLDDYTHDFKEKLLIRLERNASKEQENALKDILHERLNKLPSKLASDVLNTYIQEVERFNDAIKDILRNGFKLSVDETYHFLSKNENNIFSFTNSEIKIIFKQMNGSLLSKFNDSFKKDSSGKIRDWREIEEDQIKELYEQSRESIIEILDQFSRIELTKGITSRDTLTTPGGEDELDETVDYTENALKKTNSIRKSTLSFGGNRVISEETMNQVRQKFLSDAEFVYEEALLKHRNIGTGGIPVYIWVALAWFASDNILGWFASPILFYPLTFLLIILGAAYQLGLLPIFNQIWAPVIKAKINEVLTKTPLTFRFD